MDAGLPVQVRDQDVEHLLSVLCLDAGLPVQVRDQALKIHDEIPKSDVGKEYYQQNLEKEVTIDNLLLCGDGNTTRYKWFV